MKRWIVKASLWSLVALLVLVCRGDLAFVALSGPSDPNGQARLCRTGQLVRRRALASDRCNTAARLLCARSVAGYPQQLARTLNMPIVDMIVRRRDGRSIVAWRSVLSGPADPHDQAANTACHDHRRRQRREFYRRPVDAGARAAPRRLRAGWTRRLWNGPKK